MLLNRWTASSSDRNVECTANLTLVHEKRLPGEAAIRGSAIHTYIENLMQSGSKDVSYRKMMAAHPDVEDLAKWTRRIEERDIYDLFSLYGGETWMNEGVEIKMAWNPKTGETIRLEGDQRDYSAVDETWIVGTADVVLKTPTKVIVIDWKSGKWIKNPRDLWQMKLLTVMAADLFNRDEGTAIIAPINTRGIRPERLEVADFDIFDLSAYRHKITQAFFDALEGGTFRPNDGVCRFCPARTNCPALGEING